MWPGREAATPTSARPSATSARTTCEFALTSSTASGARGSGRASIAATNASAAEWLAARRTTRAGVADAGHHLADLVGGLEQRARVPVQPAPGGGQRDAARRALEQARADLGLERREPLGQRRLRDVQPHRGAAERAEVGGDAERPQLVQVGRQAMRSAHDHTRTRRRYVRATTDAIRSLPHSPKCMGTDGDPNGFRRPLLVRGARPDRW